MNEKELHYWRNEIRVSVGHVFHTIAADLTEKGKYNLRHSCEEFEKHLLKIAELHQNIRDIEDLSVHPIDEM